MSACRRSRVRSTGLLSGDEAGPDGIVEDRGSIRSANVYVVASSWQSSRPSLEIELAALDVQIGPVLVPVCARHCTPAAFSITLTARDSRC